MFTKIKNVDSFSMYVCQLNIQLAHQHRYLIALVPKNVHFSGHTLPFLQLNCTVFQTRKLDEVFHGLRPHTYQPKNVCPYDQEIVEIKRNDTMVSYKTNNSSTISSTIQIHLLNDSTNQYDYPKLGRLNSALETYNCVIELN